VSRPLCKQLLPACLPAFEMWLSHMWPWHGTQQLMCPPGRAVPLAWLACNLPACCYPAGLPQWCSVAPHVDPLLCGVTAVGEHLLWDI
jgi:hypothetical protein